MTRPAAQRALVLFVTLAALAGALPATAAAPHGSDATAAGRAAALRTQLAGGGTDAAAAFREAVSRQLIVSYRADVTPAGRAAVHAGRGLTVRGRSELVRAELLDVPPGQDRASVAAALARDPRVVSAVPNRVVHPSSHPSPDDPKFGKLWGLRNRGQKIRGTAGVRDVDVDAPEAWSVTHGGRRSSVVAVIDTGVDVEHPDLAGRIWTNPREIPDNGVDDDGNGFRDDVHGWDFYNRDNSVYDPWDGDEHGTHVAGTIAANVGNGTGVAGVAPRVRIMALKFIGPFGGTDFDAIKAIEYATAMGVRVSNNSWGGPGRASSLCRKDPLCTAIRRSRQAFIAAAGNEGGSNDDPDRASYPASYNLANIVSVAAVNNRGGLPRFSNRGGRSVDVGGPGVNVLSTVPKRPELITGLQVSGGAYRAMSWGFGLEDVSGAGKREEMIRKALRGHLGTPSGGRVLLVDDDESPDLPNTAPYYVDALEAAGFTVGKPVRVRPDKSGPSLRNIVDAVGADGTVVWETGYAFGLLSDKGRILVPTLTKEDRAALREFLKGGGKLLLAGADAIFGSERSALVAKDLGVDWLGENATRFDLRGAPRSVYEGRSYSTSAADAPFLFPNPFRDVVQPAAGGPATTALRYPGASSHARAYAYFTGTSMASPHAAGVAALAAGRRRGASAAELADIVKASSVGLDSLKGKTTTGGLVNARSALRGRLVRITAPAATATVRGRVTLAAAAFASNGIRRVEFFVGGSKVGSDDSRPYAVRWDSRTRRNGSARVYARVVERGGRAFVSARRGFTVAN